MEKFIAGQRDCPAQVGSALAADDWPTARRLAHTLKGTAAQIGATTIRDLAETLEHAIARPEPIARVLALQEGLDAPLLDLIEAMAQRLHSVPGAAAAPAEPLDEERLDKVYDRLAIALTACDFASGHMLAEHESLLRAGLGDA